MTTQTNATLDTTLTWAVPVRIETLGAHLEAYIQTLPTVIALRLCGRFGTGPQCHIDKLPVELICAIEPFIVEPARAEADHSAPTDAQSSGATDVVDEKTAKWPQLVSLTKSRVEDQ